MAKAYVRPRPIRVAYLVEEIEHWKPMFDAIFQTSFALWGGRFNLVVPCTDQTINSKYLPWLTRYDPDIIYSYVDLEESYVERLHEAFYPAFLVKHRFSRHERDVYDFVPHLPISMLSALSVAPIASLGSPLSPSHPVSLIDCHLAFKPSLFLKETFGFYSRGSRSWPLPHDLRPYIKTLTVVPDAIKSDRHLIPQTATDTVPTEAQLLERIRAEKDLIGMAQLAASFAPRLVVRTSWTNRINLIVGDSFSDRTLFWNARSLQEAYLDKSVVTLKIEEADLDDDGRFEAIAGIIRDRIYVSNSGASNSNVAIISSSLSNERLKAVRDRFSTADKWNIFSASKASSADDCVPNAEELQYASQSVETGLLGSNDWHEMTFSGDRFRPSKVAPRHIRDVAQLPTSVQGAWAMELDIERDADHSRYQNVKHHWRLPRRLRLANAFVRAYGLGPAFGRNFVPRVTDHGLIGFFAAKDGEMPEVEIPTDEDVFRSGLCGMRDWLPFDYGRGPVHSSLAYEMRPSDKGRYLTALLRLAGGVQGASDIFLNRFWLNEFERLGASTKTDDDRVSVLVSTLKKRLKSGQIVSQADWERLARVVSQEARQIRLAQRYIRFDHLSDRFETYRGQFWSMHEAATPREEWDEDEKASLADSVRYLCSREILHQGNEWRCPHCKNNNWISIDALGRTMICEVCASSAPAPVADAWHFKLNSFVTEGLRDHGLLANIWCLHRLAGMADRSFYFLEPHELFFNPNSASQGTPDAELDLMACVDGALHLCEAKTSSRDIDIQKFARVARHLRPDVASLAVMEAGSLGLDRARSELERLLADTDIDVQVFFLNEHDIDGDPYLPTGTRFSIALA